MFLANVFTKLQSTSMILLFDIKMSLSAAVTMHLNSDTSEWYFPLNILWQEIITMTSLLFSNIPWTLVSLWFSSLKLTLDVPALLPCCFPIRAAAETDQCDKYSGILGSRRLRKTLFHSCTSRREQVPDGTAHFSLLRGQSMSNGVKSGLFKWIYPTWKYYCELK